MSNLSLNLDSPELAQQYEQVSSECQFRGGCELIQALNLQIGEKVLDVGTGTGLIAEYVADLVGENGEVIGIDPLASRIDIAISKERPNLKFRIGNVYDLGTFITDSFDVVYLNAVFHWLPEKREPLRQIFRVLKHGGRLGITTAAKGTTNRLQEVCCEVLSRAPYNKHQDIKQLVIYRINEEELRADFRATGFILRMFNKKDYSASHRNSEAAINFVQASSFGNFLGHLPQNLQQRAYAEIVASLEGLRTPNGIPDDGTRILAIAFKE